MTRITVVRISPDGLSQKRWVFDYNDNPYWLGKLSALVLAAFHTESRPSKRHKFAEGPLRGRYERISQRRSGMVAEEVEIPPDVAEEALATFRSQVVVSKQPSP